MVHNLNNLIVSKTVRDYCEKINKEFTLEEEANLIINNPTLNFTEKLEYLKSIFTACTEKDTELRQELEIAIKYMVDLKNKLLEKDNTIFSFSFYFENRGWSKEDLYFSDFNKCLAYIKSELEKDEFLEESPTKFEIRKNVLDRPDFIYSIFDTNLNLLYIENFMSGFLEDLKEKLNNSFAEKYVEIPHPFKKGDFVKSISSRIFKIGIVTDTKNESKADKYDISIPINYIDYDFFVDADALIQDIEAVSEKDLYIIQKDLKEILPSLVENNRNVEYYKQLINAAI